MRSHGGTWLGREGATDIIAEAIAAPTGPSSISSPCWRITADMRVRSSSRAAPSSPIPERRSRTTSWAALLSVENDLPAGEWHFRRALETGGSNAGPLANLAVISTRRRHHRVEAVSRRRTGSRRGPSGSSRTGPSSGRCRATSPARSGSSTPRRGRPPPRRSTCCACNSLPGPGATPRRSRSSRRPTTSTVKGSSSGRLYERVGRHVEAWADDVEGKRKLAAEYGGPSDDAAGVAALYRAMREHFSVRDDGARGSARVHARRPAATGLHPGARRVPAATADRAGAVRAQRSARGRRALLARRVARRGAAAFAGAEGTSPAASTRSAAADERHLAAVLRDHYFARAETAGLTVPGARLFTDKTPFNEMNLPVLLMAFPEAKLVLVKRDPRDVAVSMMANNLSHGFNCAFRIEDIVRRLARRPKRRPRGLRARAGYAAHVLQYERFVADHEN